MPLISVVPPVTGSKRGEADVAPLNADHASRASFASVKAGQRSAGHGGRASSAARSIALTCASAAALARPHDRSAVAHCDHTRSRHRPDAPSSNSVARPKASAASAASPRASRCSPRLIASPASIHPDHAGSAGEMARTSGQPSSTVALPASILITTPHASARVTTPRMGAPPHGVHSIESAATSAAAIAMGASIVTVAPQERT